MFVVVVRDDDDEDEDEDEVEEPAEEDEIDSVQRENRKRWQQVRTNILNKGHAQARGLIQEMMLYDIRFAGYHCDMKPEDRR